MFVEMLEVRALMSVSPVDSQVAADRAQIKTDLQKFESDCTAVTTTLQADIQALAAADLKQDKTLAPLFKTFHSDVNSMLSQLKADNLAEGSAVTKDQAVIVAELEKIAADQGNKKALEADYIVLRADRIQLQNDEIAGLDSRLSTRQTDYNTLFNDLNKITSALASDTGASAALKADVNRFLGDRTRALDTLDGDLNKLVADRTKLVTDLTAEQNQV